MIVKVHEHKLEIEKSPVNELEVNITKIKFEFDEGIEGTKEAYFTFNGHTYKVLIVNDECNIPSEVLTEKGQVQLGVVVFTIEDEETIERYNPSPAYFNTWEGSLKEADNTEPITPSEMEQFEQALNDGLLEVANVDIDASKINKTTSVSITNRNGETKTVFIYDGLDGADGTNGKDGVDGKDGADGKDAKINGVNTLSIEAGENITLEQEGNTLTINATGGGGSGAVSSVNGKTGAVVLTTNDLTNDSGYVKNTDYAIPSKAGVIKSGYNGLQVDSTNGKTYCDIYTYANYGNVENQRFISKGTLENVITGKGLINNQVNDLTNYTKTSELSAVATSGDYDDLLNKPTIPDLTGYVKNTDYATSSTGGVIRANATRYGLFVGTDGLIKGTKTTLTDYESKWDEFIPSKYTLDLILDDKIGSINSVLDTINGENI